MASKHLSLLSLFLVISTLRVHARDSQFFSKVIPNNNNNNLVDEVKDTQLTPQREEDLPRFTQQSRNGYGLYGHDEIQNPQFNEVPNGGSSSSNLPVGDEFAVGHEKFEFNNNNENYENMQFRENGYKGRQNNMPDNFYNNNYDGYKSEEFNNNRFKDEQFMRNNDGYKGNNNNNNYNEFRTGEFNNNDNNNAYKGEQFNNNNNNMFQNERQGMSDTRFLEHGRYYYNAKNDNLTPNREFGSGSSDREVENSRNQYYNGGFNNGNNNNNKNINDDDFDP
ncbi:hypothetical protein Syun_027609 [Stephania yunnanensis]|uniref:Uncharacterized protein n=1 Tax=Stephania yunnanensis TaxID=152371 RepID=A0AAP0HL72_9MAGN